MILETLYRFTYKLHMWGEILYRLKLYIVFLEVPFDI